MEKPSSIQTFFTSSDIFLLKESFEIFFTKVLLNWGCKKDIIQSEWNIYRKQLNDNKKTPQELFMFAKCANFEEHKPIPYTLKADNMSSTPQLKIEPQIENIPLIQSNTTKACFQDFKIPDLREQQQNMQRNLSQLTLEPKPSDYYISNNENSYRESKIKTRDRDKSQNLYRQPLGQNYIKYRAKDKTPRKNYYSNSDKKENMQFYVCSPNNISTVSSPKYYNQTMKDLAKINVKVQDNCTPQSENLKLQNENFDILLQTLNKGIELQNKHSLTLEFICNKSVLAKSTQISDNSKIPFNRNQNYPSSPLKKYKVCSKQQDIQELDTKIQQDQQQYKLPAYQRRIYM